jgi:YD repeat-containing protein
LSVNNTANGLSHSYNYNGLYRLINANGSYTGADSKMASYTLNMQYDNLHNIVSKKQHVEQSNIVFNGTLKAGYELSYSYASNPFQISTLQDENYRTEGDVQKDKIANEHQYKYDSNGNLLYINTSRKKQDGTVSQGSNEKKYL